MQPRPIISPLGPLSGVDPVLLPMTKQRKKLIEVALPLDAINAASAREKSIRHGHPSTLHLWWARRPLAAARAVIFAQMVDDPSEYVDVLRGDDKARRRAEGELKRRKKAWDEAAAIAEKAARAGISAPPPGPEPTLDGILEEQERQRLFKIIEDLVQWENTANETVLDAARAEIWNSWRRTCAENADHPRAKELFDRHKLPAFHDPFAGGGSLPLEAQRLGLEAYASDLNPVAVLINKAMIEIPPKFAGRPPVNPESRRKLDHSKQWKGAEGLAEDVRYYGQWMRDEAEKRIGHLYPKVEITAEMAAERPDLKPYVGQSLTVIAWIWARTVRSPNPACADMHVPLASTFLLSTKPGKEAHVVPIVESGSYKFTVRLGTPQNAEATNGTKVARGSHFRCLLSGAPITGAHIKTEGLAGRMSARLMAIVAKGDHGRIYLPPAASHEEPDPAPSPRWTPDEEIAYDAHSGATYCVLYGMTRFADVFTHRQLVALNTFSDVANEARRHVRGDAVTAGWTDGAAHHDDGPTANEYAQAVELYLAFVISRLADYWSSLNAWQPFGQKLSHTFSRQAIPMVWDYAEANPFSRKGGSYDNLFDWTVQSLPTLSARTQGYASQQDATLQDVSRDRVVSTDPPYYDNVPYADLSDYFYVWLRRILRPQLEDLFTTVATPKSAELVAFASRHGSKVGAEEFFVKGMTKALHRLAALAHPGFPVTLYYAFRQNDGVAGTNAGWETFLEALSEAGYGTTGTWPMRTEMANRMRGQASNALASSIVLVCRPRPDNAHTLTRREFISRLKFELPVAVAHLQRSNIAPVDLAQAAIGPGMAVYTRYAKVLEPDGSALPVREALKLINQVLDEVLAEQEGDFDADTRFALAWFDQQGFAQGEFGVADVLARAKNTAVDGMVQAGILKAGAGKVRLLKPGELPADWDPARDRRTNVWELLHQLLRVFNVGREEAAADLVAKYGVQADTVRELAYRLYTSCERRKRAQEAFVYNALVQSWPEITRLALGRAPTQGDMFAEA